MSRIHNHVLGLAFVLCTMYGALAFCDAAGDRAEIDGLLHRIELSQCRFYRNGSGYSGEQAAQHLRAKWDLASKRLSIEMTADQFIIEIASTSSITGRAYTIDCGEGSQPLSKWLSVELTRMR